MSFLSLFGMGRKVAHERHPFVLHGEVDREDDGRWIVEITDLPGVMVYGASEQEAVNKAIALALRVMADRVEQGDVAAATQGLSLDLCMQHA